MRRVWMPLAILAAALPIRTTPTMAQATSSDHAVLYRLERDSTFQRGCFPPCECPVMQQVPLGGTFRLIYTGFNGVFDTYDVRNARFKVVLGGIPTWITGSGTYWRGGEVGIEHALELDLAVGNDPPQHFSSGPGRNPANPDFPRIVISISIHGEYCFDTVLRLDARPARRLHVARDDLFWDPEPQGATYDVVMGDLASLSETGGGFDVATGACVAASHGDVTIPFGADPVAGRAFWFLVRPEGDSYDDGDWGQVGSADAGIAASPAACP